MSDASVRSNSRGNAAPGRAGGGHLAVFSPADIVSRPPVTLIHGDADDVVPPAVFERNAEALRLAGLTVDTHVVAGLTHGIDATALRYLCDALQRGFAD